MTNIYGVVYMTTFIPTGETYIGITTKKEKAFHEYYGSGLVIQRYLKKHSIDNFSKKVLYEASTREELSEKERYFIQTLKPDLNISAGGEGGNLGEKVNKKLRDNHADYTKENHPAWGKKRSEETREKMRIAWRKKENRQHTEEWKKEHSRKMSGKNSPFYGKNLWENLTEEETNRRKEILRRRLQNNPINTLEKPNRGKKIKCITTGETFLSIRQAEAKTGIKRWRIAEYLKNQKPLPDGSIWTEI